MGVGIETEAHIIRGYTQAWLLQSMFWPLDDE